VPPNGGDAGCQRIASDISCCYVDDLITLMKPSGKKWGQEGLAPP